VALSRRVDIAIPLPIVLRRLVWIDLARQIPESKPRIVMSIEVYVSKNPRKATLAIIEHANRIISEYASQGFKLTLRQLYYQFVARSLFSENTQAKYKNLGRIICDGRDGGLIDWEAIEDRTRVVHTHSAWDNPPAIIYSAAHSYQEDWWKGQRYRPEVWIEKDALLGVIEGVCTDMSIGCRTFHIVETIRRLCNMKLAAVSPNIWTKVCIR
jgi:hypothetical protein